LNYENVLAAADGVVQLAGSDSINPCFGQTIILNHPNGYSTRYAHLSQIYVGAGQSVARGQVIAQSGNTGCSSGPHLHFGAYITSSWTAIDPWGWWGAPGADPWGDPADLWLTGSAQFPLPSAPTNVQAIAGNASVTVSWAPPSFNGGSGISSYTITSSPGGISVSASGNATSAVLTGLSNGTMYTFSVTAQNNVGATLSQASNPVVPSAWVGQYRAMAPVRILDTRNGISQPLVAQQTITIPVAGQAGIPTGGIPAVLLNVTSVWPQTDSYLTVWPTGSPRPTTSSLNFKAGQTISNLVEVPVGVGGDINIFNWTGATHVVVDMVGFVSNDLIWSMGLFHPIEPSRLVDTRTSSGPVGDGQTINVQVTGQGGVPATGVSAALVNLTVVSQTGPGYITAYASGASRPTASNINYDWGQTISNRTIVPLSSDGKLAIYNFHGSVNVIVDVSGWFTDGSATEVQTGQFVGINPARIYDTRTGPGALTAGVRTIAVAGQGGVPNMTDTAPPTAVVLNMTVIKPQAAGFLTVFASGSTQPTTSDVNFPAGAIESNLVVSKVGADGKISIYNLIGATDIAVDVLGYYN
ncbi:MAG TPA: peptidoglycan DD-metalloendopeptidase family protein, partial [Mycobacterium sp.]|nr:peptidoglycan DD-metalloendopeptidase family protein [Mycobacterium sp.]